MTYISCVSARDAIASSFVNSALLAYSSELIARRGIEIVLSHGSNPVWEDKDRIQKSEKKRTQCGGIKHDHMAQVKATIRSGRHLTCRGRTQEWKE